MHDVIFREYDIRGIVGQELYIESVYALAQAIAAYFLDKRPLLRTVVVGMDVRTHSPEIKYEVCRGFIDSGIDVIDIGMCSSPMLYYAVSHLKGDAGIMVTASHNPKEYNGLKIYLGIDMVHSTELQIIKMMYQQQSVVSCVQQGVLHVQNIQPNYIASLCSEFRHLKGMSLPIVFDCANGSASVVIPDLIQAMQWPCASALYALPDGTFPHHPADPIIEDNMQDLVVAVSEQQAIVGIGFDGDADRMGVIAADGTLVCGDKLLALFAKHMSRSINNLAVVHDITASQGLAELLSMWDIQSIVSPCGQSHIKKYMNQHSALLGGEVSCHFVFADRGCASDDGIYASLRLLEILHEHPTALVDLLAEFPHKISSPRYRLACAEQEKKALVDTVYTCFKDMSDTTMITIDGTRASTPQGWALVRASNTQAVICFSFEADSECELKRLQRLVADALVSVYEHDLYTTFGL